MKCDPPETKAHPGPRYRLRAVESSPQPPKWLEPLCPDVATISEGLSTLPDGVEYVAAVRAKERRPARPTRHAAARRRTSPSILASRDWSAPCLARFIGQVSSVGRVVAYASNGGCSQRLPQCIHKAWEAPRAWRTPTNVERAMVGMAVSVWLGKGETWRAHPSLSPAAYQQSRSRFETIARLFSPHDHGHQGTCTCPECRMTAVDLIRYRSQ